MELIQMKCFGLKQGSWNYAPKFCKLCATILKIMRALFANYAHIMRTFIGFVLHIFGIQHRQCDIISGIYHKHVTFICAVCRANYFEFLMTAHFTSRKVVRLM